MSATALRVVERIRKLPALAALIDAHVLLALADCDGAQEVRNIALTIGETMPNASRAISRLMRNSLVIKSKDGGDQRRVLVYLTPAGQTTAKEIGA